MDGNIAATYTLIHSFLVQRSHKKIADALKKAVKDVVVLKDDIDVDGPRLDEIVKHWKLSTKVHPAKKNDTARGSDSGSDSSSSGLPINKSNIPENVTPSSKAGLSTHHFKPSETRARSASSSSTGCDSSDSEAEEPTKANIKPAVVRRGRAQSSSSSSDTDSSEPKSKPPNTKTRSSSSSSSRSGVEQPAKSNMKPVAIRCSQSAKSGNSSSSSDTEAESESSSSSEDDSPPLQKRDSRAMKTARPLKESKTASQDMKKADQAQSESSGSDDEEGAKSKMTKIAAKVEDTSSAEDQSSSDSSLNEEHVETATKKLHQEEESSSSEGDLSEEEASLPPKQVKSKLVSNGIAAKHTANSHSESKASAVKQNNVDVISSKALPVKDADGGKVLKKRRTDSGKAVSTATTGASKDDVKVKGTAPQANGKSNGKTARGLNERFKRVDPEKYQAHVVGDNRYDAKVGPNNDYGKRAHQDLVVTRGAGFRKEKNKKKRGSYRGGEITMESHSFKFTD